MTLQVDSGWSQALMDVSVHFQVWAGAHYGVERGTHPLLLREYNTSQSCAHGWRHLGCLGLGVLGELQRLLTGSRWTAAEPQSRPLRSQRRQLL